MQTLIPINLVIGDRSYRVKIQPADEESVRKTLKTINEKIIEFKTQFSGKDMQDYIAMVVLWYATQGQDGGGDSKTDLAVLLDQMEQQIDKVL
jgi:cell division protein ZapA